MDLVTGNDYQINNVSVLNATTLGGAVVASSLTSVGALNTGSITSGFTSIDVGAGAITTTGTLSGGTIASGGRTLGYKGSDVTSANDITLGQGNFFGVLGTTTIERIASAGWADGSVITLGTAASVQISNDVASGGGFNQIALAGSADIAMTAGSTLTLIISSTKWKEVSRMLR